MRGTALTSIILLCLGLSSSRTRQITKLSSVPEPAIFLDLITQGNVQFSTGNYQSALNYYRAGLNASNLAKHDRVHTRLLIGSANCLGAMRDFGQALRLFSQADHIATRAHLYDLRERIAVGRASLYRMMDDVSSAIQVMQSVDLSSSNDPLVLLQAANIQRYGNLASARSLYHSAVQAAITRGNRSAEAAAWTHLGYALLLNGKYDEAERALVEGFRIRKLTASRQTAASLFYLGLLRAAQNLPNNALQLYTRAIEVSEQTAAPIPLASIYYQRARARQAEGDLDGALVDLRRAAKLAREWREDIVQAETARISAEVSMRDIHAALVAVGMEIYQRSHNRGMAWEMLEVAEQSRVAIARSSFASNGLPGSYWETLAQYRTALIANLAHKETDQLSALRLRLTDIEAEHGLFRLSDASAGANTVQLQRRLQATDAVLAFHIGEHKSYLWAFTRNSFETHVLPGRHTLTNYTLIFRNSLTDRLQHGKTSRDIYEILFKHLSRKVLKSKSWLLILDGPLHDLPFAALLDRANGYLAQRYVLRTMSGVGGEGPAANHQVTRFVGVGDAVYNAADPRSVKGVRPVKEFARLAGSSTELAASANAWARDPGPTLLRGRNVSRRNIEEAVAVRPAVLHFATHMFQHPRAPDQVMIALGVQPSGEVEFLTPHEISRWTRSAQLVTLSGCASGGGAVLPGIGVFGLTRAWMLAGATSVIATYWPIRDTKGELMTVMYRELQSFSQITPESVAEALQRAQVRMIESTGWQADPSHWSAFFVVARQ